MIRWKRFKRRWRYNRKRSFMNMLLVLLLFSFGLGYATLKTDLSIDGTSQFLDARWNVYFDNLVVENGSVTPISAANIVDSTTINFSVKLENPGDYYRFHVDVINGGNMVAMVDSINISPVLSDEQKNYLKYDVTYADGISIDSFHKLDIGAVENILVNFQYLENADASLYPTEDQSFTIAVSLTYVQADSRAIDRPVLSLENASWNKILQYVNTDSICDVFSVGDVKTIDMGSFGTHQIRLANCSLPTECNDSTNFSQTACGVVFEFTDIVSYHNFNSSKTNEGGWPVSQIRTYLNNDFYNALPTDIKNSILDVNAITGHGKKESSNFKTTDKIYLLAPTEVWGVGGASDRDSAETLTRQLDYYNGLGITGSGNNPLASKYDTSTNTKKNWWLRTSDNADNDDFLKVNNAGHWGDSTADLELGVSPAFRIK